MDYKSLILLALLLFTWVTPAAAKHLHLESWYQEQWCTAQAGQAEVRMKNLVRVDCITKTHAVEVDFAQKWYEGVTQALYYAKLTGKRAGLLIIIEKESDLKFVKRMVETITYYRLPIDFWFISAN